MVTNEMLNEVPKPKTLDEWYAEGVRRFYAPDKEKMKDESGIYGVEPHFHIILNEQGHYTSDKGFAWQGNWTFLKPDPQYIQPLGTYSKVNLKIPHMIENIDHPKHYTHGSIECIDVIEDWQFGYHEGNALKYLCRWKHKNGVEDLKKARWYLDRLIKKNDAIAE